MQNPSPEDLFHTVEGETVTLSILEDCHESMLSNGHLGGAELGELSSHLL